jgi:hypothetical protein
MESPCFCNSSWDAEQASIHLYSLYIFGMGDSVTK